MELKIHFTTLPEGKALAQVEEQLAEIMEDDGWITASQRDAEGGFIELELEDEKANPKYGILAVKYYLQREKFAPDTTIELAGTSVGIYA